jgi:hypothetical protein
MIDSDIRDQLMNQLGRLPLPAQRQVLDYASSLTLPSETRDFHEFAGTLDPRDAEEMIRAIEEDCQHSFTVVSRDWHFAEVSGLNWEGW